MIFIFVYEKAENPKTFCRLLRILLENLSQKSVAILQGFSESLMVSIQVLHIPYIIDRKILFGIFKFSIQSAQYSTETHKSFAKVSQD